MNRTTAGVSSSSGIRSSAAAWFSTDTPSQTLGNGHEVPGFETPAPVRRAATWSICWMRHPGSSSGTMERPSTSRLSTHRNHSRIRSARFVSTWNAWRGEAAITPNTAAISSLVSFSWKRSDIELTKMRRGRRHRSGSARCSGTMRTSPVQRASMRCSSSAITLSLLTASPSYGCPDPREPRGDALGVAVAATLAHARAAANGVPRRVGPADAGPVSHREPPPARSLPCSA
jgi:hypothetical protein